MARTPLDPFHILLNDLSHGLDERNLQSLIHVCGEYIPGCQRERIFSGWDVFSILRRQNVIGTESQEISNLLAIIKEVRPRRTGLVNKVKQYIQEWYDDAETLLEELQLGWEFNGQLRLPSSRSSTPGPGEDCCRIRCGGFACNYNHSNSCCYDCCIWYGVILGVLFFVLSIVAALAWYSSIPEVTKYLKSNDDRKDAGPFAIGSLIFLALCSAGCAICLKYRQRRNARRYAMLPNVSESISNQASYPTSEHSCRSTAPTRINARSFSSGHITASTGSIASRCSRGSCSIAHTSRGADSAPDGFPEDELSTPDAGLDGDDEME